jgi:hypothetical protein
MLLYAIKIKVPGTQYIYISYHQNAGLYHNIKRGSGWWWFIPVAPTWGIGHP